MPRRPDRPAVVPRAALVMVATSLLMVPGLARGSGQEYVYFRPPANLSHSPTASRLPQSSPRSLALHPNGRAFLIWVEVVPHSRGTALELALCQYFADTGWDTTITAIGRWEGANSTDPACVVDANQVLHLAWVDEGSGARQVVGTSFNLRTGALSETVAISRPPGVPADPALAAAVDGSVHALWSETGDDGGASLRCRSWTATGWDSIAVIAADRGTSVSFPDIACDPRGVAHAAWLRTRHSSDAVDETAVMYASRSPEGRWSGAEEVREPALDWSPGPPVVAVSSDQVWVVWSEAQGSSARIELRRNRGGGWSAIGSPSASPFAGDPSSAIDTRGALHLVWLEGPDVHRAWSVAYSHLAPGDTAFAPPRALTASGEGPFATPIIASDPHGRVAAAWVDAGTGRGDIICRNGVVGFALPAGPRHPIR